MLLLWYSGLKAAIFHCIFLALPKSLLGASAPVAALFAVMHQGRALFDLRVYTLMFALRWPACWPLWSGMALAGSLCHHSV